MEPQGNDRSGTPADSGTPATAQAAAREPEVRPPGRMRMRLAIVLVAMAFLATVFILWDRSWLHAPANPASLLVVRGDEPYRGARVRVEGPAGTFEGTILPESKYVCSFHLPPGRYMLRVSLDGAAIEEGIVNVGEHQYRLVTLTRLRKNAGPATSPS